MPNEPTVAIYINLPEEGSPTLRPTQALDMGNGQYKVLATADYDPEDEVWEFVPDTIVRCKMTPTASGKTVLLAYDRVNNHDQN